MTGRLDARSELVMCTNRRTGAVYTTMRKRTQTVEPTDKQREARQLFADRIHSIKQWIRANGPGRNPEHPQGTPAYLRLRNAFLEQTEIKSMMASNANTPISSMTPRKSNPSIISLRIASIYQRGGII